MFRDLKLSVVTPSYNHGRFLEQTILSILNQDYSNIEYIIIDGASQDNSVDIIRKYQKHITYWVSEPDKDLRYALQKGFSRASGDILAWQNADDYYMPNVIGHVMRIFNENPKIDLIYGNVKIVDENNLTVDKLFHIPLHYPLDIFGGMPFQNHAAFIRRRLWEKAGGITFYELNYDVDLVFRLAKFATPYFLNSFLGAYRKHPQSLSFSGSSENLQKDFWPMRRRVLGRWGKLPKWSYLAIVILSKLRRYFFLAFMREWDYFSLQINKLWMRLFDKYKKLIS